METYHKIKSLGISIEDLYLGTKQLRVHLSDSKFVYSVILIGRDKQPDCLISSFEANLYFRTKNGINKKAYKDLAGLQESIDTAIYKYVAKVGVISYSLSDEINLF